LIYQNLFKQLS